MGKSTLLKIISGMEKPDEGQVFFEGKDLKKIKRQKLWGRHFSFVFQNYFLLDDKTVRKNLKLACQKIGEPEMTDALKKTGLTADVLDKAVYRLSGGERQRVGIARAILKPFDVLVADEPTGNLDFQNTAAIMDVLKKLQEYKKTIIVVSHDNDFQKLADQNLLLQDAVLTTF